MEKEKLTASNLRGNWATLLLPICADQSIDFNLLETEIDRLISAKVDGIYSNGTAGEFHNQTEAEFDRIAELLAIKCTKAGTRFQVGCSHPSPIISLQRMKRTVSLKPDAFQVIMPDWVVLSGEEQLQFLTKMESEANGIPLVLYNPPHAKLELKPIDYAKFKSAVPTLIGTKVLSRGSEWEDEMKTHAGHLSIFIPGHFLASGVKTGIAAGAYSNIACINAAAAQWHWQLMSTDIEEALRIQEQLLEFFRQCIFPYANAGYSSPALDKFLAAVGGYIEIPTRLRWPYRGIPEADVPSAREIARALLPEFFKG
ncbi:MAG: dihydrodipicolinate synthase family protein [Pedobacter sp.]|nr:dihydrodipicolinate synthase family protein [Pedobacter sp.]MDQ8052224.1 dihydrodipicolinate synthase family protein [Pedobacter sp.]